MTRRLTDRTGEVRELTDEDIERMRPMDEVLPANLKRAIGQRGAQRTPTKVKTSIRLSRDVIDHFKQGGDGWQRRIDQALKQYIREHGSD
ncbi:MULTISPECIES: BrnA antitoxin family protein [Halomonas]|jgi:uncharacterized protein (DUF4415 family)|uniref:BrnA antitoxin family protein n=3 Tax=Halomonas TaxID=2745 RepID=A0AAU7KH53_9GAMM|nr:MULTISPECIES: BrnA antitoxin family protein [Halomonas]MAR71460.1 hypothetical protein [Halomonas sp.]MBS8270059.1 hypothetical protein [Halomonas litopenaei]MBY5943431.1 BrnA antitoxin family protein [Halomonas sp. DP5N14-9]NQY70594.1 BrnA antitoxin family protein [Halomonas sp.]PTL91744.1 hypothetical protein C6W89_06645 [Halomonas sp. SYSU XM8]